MDEPGFIELLRGAATDPAARGLRDDAAVLPVGGVELVLTHDMLVEGVHFLTDSPAGRVAQKLVAVNMSDLAAKGATPVGMLLGYGGLRDPDWDADFAEGLAEASRAYGAALLGGDTVRMPEGAPLTLGLTAIGIAPATGAPSRSGARAGDDLWVCGPIGDAGAGLVMHQGGGIGWSAQLWSAYLHSEANIPMGRDVAPLVSAMADVSDGLLIDAQRIAEASGCGLAIELGAIPLSGAYLMARPESLENRLLAATAGDDYKLIFTAGPDQREAIEAVSLRRGGAAVRIGSCGPWPGLRLTYQGAPVPLPSSLGYVHGG
jgi:thiamine-monophosphate kinase